MAQYDVEGKLSRHKADTHVLGRRVFVVDQMRESASMW